MTKKSLMVLLSSALVAGSMMGCTTLFVGGIAWVGGNTIATVVDRRSTGAVVNDKVLEKRIVLEIKNALQAKFGTEITSHITVTAYNGRALLTGEVPTEEAKAVAKQVALKSLDVAEVVDELFVGPESSITQRLLDTKTATEVRTRIIGNKDGQLNQMKVTVDRDIVYLMGILTAGENAAACRIASHTSGVKRVISIVEVMSEEQILNRQNKFLQEQEKTQNQTEGSEQGKN